MSEMAAEMAEVLRALPALTKVLTSILRMMAQNKLE